MNAEKSHDCFEYLNCVAEAIGLNVRLENGGALNVLAHNYAKIDFVEPDGIFGAFLGGKMPESGQAPPKAVAEPIYPFGFNASQKEAVDNALANRFSIIEGPPGTGKTQTILNIIANALMREESVAVVSSNNSATMNVQDKLRKYGVDFIAAYLGNYDNKNEFINSQKTLPDMAKWRLEPEMSGALRQKLNLLQKLLREKLAQKNELSVLQQELSAVEAELEHFRQYSGQIAPPQKPAAAMGVKTSRCALDMWLLCETYEEPPRGKGIVAFFKSIFGLFRLISGRVRKVRKLLKQYPRDCLIVVFQLQFYELRIAELTHRIAKLADALEMFDFDAKMGEHSEMSMRLFRAELVRKYTMGSRREYELDELWKKSLDFIQDYPVILSTAYSLRGSLSSCVMYDYVIIDEASQVDLCTGALALSCARKVVVVGDLKQLPNVVDRKTAAATDALFVKFALPEVYRYKNHSLLSAVAEMFPNAPHTLLREHYRCHPKIIEFCNRKFYGNQLIVLTEPKSGRKPLLVYKTVEGSHERNRVNQRQIDVIKNEIIPGQNLDIKNGSVGIVTPYRNQTNALQSAFAGTGVKADTVDKFQGQENDIIILSTVDNAITEFADNANRLNVAISRAIEQLIVVVGDGDAQTDTNVGDLVRYIEYNNFSVIESKVYSVFDYLYKGYAGRRREFLKKQRRVSEFDSENLMYALITDVLRSGRFRRFDVAVHVPLKMLVRDTGELSPPEKQYVSNILTHVDFLIFDAIGKSPRLAVEVDGAAFHAEGTRQAERDSMKNKILEKYGLPLLRFRTDGSGERGRLIAELARPLAR